MLAIMATSFITLMRLDTRVTRNYVDDQRCEMLAHGMLNYFKSLLREDLNRTWGKYENRDTGMGYVGYEWRSPGDNVSPPTVRIPGLYQDPDQNAGKVYVDDRLAVPVCDDVWFCAPYTSWGTTGGSLYARNYGSIPQQSYTWNGGVVGRYYANYKGSSLSGRDYDIWLGRSQNAFADDGRIVEVHHPDALPPGIDDDMDGSINPPYWNWVADPLAAGGGSWSNSIFNEEGRRSTWYADTPPFVIYSGNTEYQCGSRMTGETMLPGGICWQWGVKVGPTHSGYANFNVHGNVDGASSGYLNAMGGLNLAARRAIDQTDSTVPSEHLGRLEWKGFPTEVEYLYRGGFPHAYNNVLYAPAAASLERLFRRDDYPGYEYINGQGHPPDVGADRAKAREIIRYRWGGGSGIPVNGNSRWRVGWRRDGASYYKFPSPENPMNQDRYFGPNEVMEHDHSVDHPGTSAIARILGDVEWQKLRPYATMWSTDTILRGKIWPGEGYDFPGDWSHIDILKRVNPNIIGASGPEGLSGEDGSLKSKWAAKAPAERRRLFYMLRAALQHTSTPNASQKACQFIASLTDMVDRDQHETYFEAPDHTAWALGVEKQPVINEVVFYSKTLANTADYELFRIRVELYNPMENIPWIPDADEAYDISNYYLKIGEHFYRLGELTRFTDDPNETYPNNNGLIDDAGNARIGADGIYAYPGDTVENRKTWSRFAHVGWSKTVNWPPGLTRLELEGRTSIDDPFGGIRFSLWKPLYGDAAANVPTEPNKVEQTDGKKLICVDKTPIIQLVQSYGPGTGRNGPGGRSTIYLGSYRRWDPMNAHVLTRPVPAPGSGELPEVKYGEDDECNVLWCEGWNIGQFPTLGKPNVDYPVDAGSSSYPTIGVSRYEYERKFERNFKIVDGDIPSIGWLGELMMMNCAQDGPLTWVHEKAQEPVRDNYWVRYRYMNELDTKAKFDLYRPFLPAGKYTPTASQMDPANLHILDIFTLWDPSNDGIDNDGDGAVDDDDTGRQAGDKCGPEIRVFGKMDLNMIPAAVMAMPWPDNKGVRDGGRVTFPVNYVTSTARTSHRSGYNFYCGPMETIGDLLRADHVSPYPGSYLCGEIWYGGDNWRDGVSPMTEFGITRLRYDEPTRLPIGGDDDGDGIYDERDERDMVFTWVANYFTTRANVFEVDINARICEPYFHPGRKLPFRSYRSKREYARKQLLGILDRSTVLRVNQDGRCDFTGPINVRMLRMSDDLSIY